MAKILTRAGAILAITCCAGASTATAQPHRGAGAAPAAPHISAPAPHLSSPAAPHVSAPAPRISAAPRFNAAPRISAAPRFNAGPRVHAAPHVATPRFSARTPSAHPFTPRGRVNTARGFAGRTVHGSNRAGGNLARSTTRERARAQAQANRTGAGIGGQATNGRNRLAQPNARNRTTGFHPGNRPTGAQLAALSRPLGERNRNDTDRHRWFEERRRFHRGGFVGWFGPVFWPSAYDDFFDYAFWPYEYDDYGFWASAYDDILANVFFTPGTEDIYASLGDGYAGGGRGGRGAERRRGREASRGGGAADICRVDPGLTQWPTEQIAQVVEPTADQRHLLDDLKAASGQAAKILQAACPTTAPSTPVGRLDAMSTRLDAMRQALDAVRPALAKFYDSLSDEQKARFNAMGRQPTAGGGQPENEARLCQTQAPAGLTDEAMDRIGQEVRPNDRQKGGLDVLRDAAAKAADILRNACPSQTPITPVARLDAVANHVKAMMDAINTVRPALERFYASLSDEQKAHFNVMSRAASNQ
jgi:hypothetical protein